MGFLRRQEERLAVRYLIWQYQRANIPLPPGQQLEQQAAKIVSEAHRIARKRGRNVVSIVKELIDDLKKE